MEERFFYQRQKFTSGWLPYVLAVSLVLPCALAFGMYQQGDRSLDIYVGPAIALAVNAMVLFGMWLDIEVSTVGIRYRFFPFIGWRTLEWSQIERIQIVHYDPLTDYGGWGIKRGKEGWVYSVTGDEGILITTTEGKKIMLGIQDTSYWQGAIKQFYNM